jgi:NTP pyrophosphatase (non-canonical NTP hydrolase)
MTLDEYTDWTDKVWKGEPFASTTDRDIAIAALGLTGEAGEVVEFFKKHLRDRKVIHRNEDLKLELGDMFFYWTRLVRIAGFTPDEVIAANVAKLTQRYGDRRILPPAPAAA